MPRSSVADTMGWTGGLLRDFVTRMDVSGTLDGKYEKNVADELRHLYSDCPRS